MLTHQIDNTKRTWPSVPVLQSPHAESGSGNVRMVSAALGSAEKALKKVTHFCSTWPENGHITQNH